MQSLRVTVAVVAASALLALGAVVAVAAPSALGNAASPSGGAADAVYCAKLLKRQLQVAVVRYRKAMPTARKAFFRTHPGTRQRTAFARAQSSQLKALKRRLARCS